MTVVQYLRFVTATNSHFPAWLAPGGEDNLQTGKNDQYRKLEPAVEAPNNPIIGVFWQDAVAFVVIQNQRPDLSFAHRGRVGIRLPQWR